MRQGRAESPWEQLTARLILGSAEFVQTVREGLRGNAREQTALRRLSERTTRSQVIAAAEKVK